MINPTTVVNSTIDVGSGVGSSSYSWRPCGPNAKILFETSIPKKAIKIVNVLIGGRKVNGIGCWPLFMPPQQYDTNSKNGEAAWATANPLSLISLRLNWSVIQQISWP